MKPLILISTLFVIAALSSAQAQPQPPADESGFTSLFNGKDLAGWQGDTTIWSVQDGCITGQTTQPKQIKENSYLIWQGGQGGEVQDFELRLSYRLENGNSGIYCRAHKRSADEKSADPVIAWQADIDDKHVWTGCIMEWTVRERLADRGQVVTIDEKGAKKITGSTGDAAKLAALIKDKDWNDYQIIAKAGHITLSINGTKMCELTDNDPRRAVKGLLALQVHAGVPMKVQFKNIRMRKL
jgi:hypothetical protein